MILDKANCTSVECLRSLPEESMRHLNDFFINETPSDAGGGLFGPAPGFGPVPDGRFIPDMPAALLQRGAFHKELRSLVLGNTANEVQKPPRISVATRIYGMLTIVYV
jgi:hypothetical protein